MAHSIVPALPEHIPHIAVHIRKDDRSEIWAAAHQLPHAALARCLSQSRMAWTGMIDDEPLCMFGVAKSSEHSAIGRPWLISTTRLNAHAHVFLKHCGFCVLEMQKFFPVLENYVLAENRAAVVWLRWLGFTLHETAPMGPDNRDFIRFSMGHQL